MAIDRRNSSNENALPQGVLKDRRSSHRPHILDQEAQIDEKESGKSRKRPELYIIGILIALLLIITLAGMH